MESSIGFLHEITQPKYPLVYGLQEPFRWIVDKTVISCVENETFNKKDFFFTDNYVLRLTPSAIKKLLEGLRQEFDTKIEYMGKYYSWDTIIQLKVRELSRYILGKVKQINFNNPNPDFNSIDSKELREKILSITTPEAKELGIDKSSLWYLKRRAQMNKSFRIYRKNIDRLVFSS